MFFIETRLWDNVCFPDKKKKKESLERKSDEEVRLEWHKCL